MSVVCPLKRIEFNHFDDVLSMDSSDVRLFVVVTFPIPVKGKYLQLPPFKISLLECVIFIEED